GWDFRESNDKRRRRFVGTSPGPGEVPAPRRFEAALGGSRLHFAADWGVFSEEGIDAGTQLLFDVASAMPSASCVLDVGVGYGALAVGLVSAGTAERAVGIDVDSVALYLAQINATAAGVPLELELADDPTTLDGTPLVVCNFPTHAKREAADGLVRALARCAPTALVLVVVHASLEHRYAKWFELGGARVAPQARDEHVVLRLTTDG
ncbi:MAG: methyltransferase, partial [Candidatus Binatia bacterium]